uniref:Uncharacterized protein n=1 Tax=Timema genevievae TaxID=629358 RepID=A0A7R9JR08_TIMGE|nr:unnamed protein product [Timema genevievae]
MMVYIKFAAFLLVVVLTQEVLGSSFDVSTGEFSNRFCSKCQPEACPEIPEKCPVGLVTDLCGCCTQGVCGVVEGEKCYNVSLEPTLPAENKKYGLCGNNLHCLLRPDLSFRKWKRSHLSLTCHPAGYQLHLTPRVVLAEIHTCYLSLRAIAEYDFHA